MEVGECYEFTHGPASHEGRKLRGVLEEIDETENSYTFRLEDGSQVSLVMREILAPKHVPGGC